MATKQSGQILPFVALMLFCIMGVVALVIDGSNIYSQQRRMQADLDTAVMVAAAELPSTSAAQTEATNMLVQRGYTNPGITINVPPQTTPYMQKTCPSSEPSPCYAEGFLTQNVRSFFAGVLGLQSMKVSVHAVAEKGGNSWQPPTLLALSPTGASNGGCGFLAQGANGVSGVLDASVHSNSQSCVKNGSIFADGEVFSDIPTNNNNGSPITSTVNGSSGDGTGTYMPDPYNPGWTVSTNPFTISAPMTSTTCPSNSPTSCATSCNTPPYNSVAPGVTYYQPNSTGIALMSNGLHTSNGTYDFLPYCDPATGMPTFGIYLFEGNLKLSSSSGQNAPVVNAYDSTFVFDYASGASTAPQIDVTGGNLYMWGPGTCPPSTPPSGPPPCAGTTSPFYGTFGSMAIYQMGAVPCGAPVTMQLGGNATGTITGIVDLPCTDITVTGNSTNAAWISGGLIAWDITVAGSGAGVVTRDPSVTPPLPRGSALVQ